MLEADAIARCYGLEKGQIVKLTFTGGVVDSYETVLCNTSSTNICYSCTDSMLMPLLHRVANIRAKEKWECFLLGLCLFS